jgi:dipeptidyl aminopeptidase/acylaminoacyl peptidase
MRIAFLPLTVVLGATLAAQPSSRGAAPTVDQLLSLKRAGSVEISPDGRLVAYTVRETNWDDNAYDTQIWIADASAGTTRQLTSSKKSSQLPRWSPDGSRLAFVSDRTDKRQIYVINPSAGDAMALTNTEDGVSSFEWSPDGKTIAYTATQPKSTAVKDRDKKYGEFEVIDQDHRMSHLWTIEVQSKAVKALTSGDFTVGSFAWSPDGKSIAFDHRQNPTPAASGTTDISIVTVADGTIRKLVTQDGPDTDPAWSPDGSRIAFETTMANPAYFYSNRVIAVIPATGGTPTPLTAAFDEDPSIVKWTAEGLFFMALERTYGYLYRLDPATKAFSKVASPDRTINFAFSMSSDGRSIAFLRSDAAMMPEVYVSSTTGRAGEKKLTDFNTQTAAWTTGTLEVVSWKSQDGAWSSFTADRPASRARPRSRARSTPLTSGCHGACSSWNRTTGAARDTARNSDR